MTNRVVLLLKLKYIVRIHRKLKEMHARRQQTIQDQENVYVGKGKAIMAVPVKRKGLGVRGALGDLGNVQIQPDIGTGKVVEAAAEFEKKNSFIRPPLRSYGHVQSKVDTGLAVKNTQSLSRPPLRREESTAVLATKATVQTRAALKESTNKSAKPQESLISLQQLKKTSQDKENKKNAKLPPVKENGKEKEKKTLKPIIKDPTESLGKLKLAEPAQVDMFMKGRKSPVSLPDGVLDIDANDKYDPRLMWTYVKDIYRYLAELEDIYNIEPNYLSKQAIVTGTMRAILIDWLVEVHRQFALLLETLHLAIGILDRYLQATTNVARNQLQLVGITALYIACKYEEVYAPDVGDFVCITANAYTKAEVFTCERDIMSKLGFCLARPIPVYFLRRFVKAANATSKQYHLTKYFVDLCLVEYTTAHYRPSELAAAAVCLCLHLLTNKTLEQVWTPTLEYYSKYNLEHLRPIIKRMAKLVVKVQQSRHKAVYTKYLDVTLGKVADLPQLKSEAIYDLANDEPPFNSPDSGVALF